MDYRCRRVETERFIEDSSSTRKVAQVFGAGRPSFEHPVHFLMKPCLRLGVSGEEVQVPESALAVVSWPAIKRVNASSRNSWQAPPPGSPPRQDVHHKRESMLTVLVILHDYLIANGRIVIRLLPRGRLVKTERNDFTRFPILD